MSCRLPTTTCPAAMEKALSIIFLFYFRVCFSRDVNGIPLEECQLKHPQNWTTYYCGYELGSNYSKRAVFSCKPEGGPPKLYRDCNLKPSGDEFTKNKFCVKSNSKSELAPFVRGCTDITYCTPKEKYCGFKNIEEVKQEIISSTPAIGRPRQALLNWLDDNIKKEKQSKNS